MSGDVIGKLRAAVDAVAALDPSEVVTAEGTAEVLEELQRAMRRLDFQFHRILRAFQARGDHVPLGYATAKQFCRHRLGMTGQRAGAALKLSRDLLFVPSSAERWAAGDVDAARVRVVASARTERTRDRFDEWEPWLAEQAATFDLGGLRVVVKRWRLRVDPDDDGPERRDDERDAHVSKTFEDTVAVDAILPVVGGDVFKRVFDRRLRPLVIVVTGLEALAHGLAELWDRTPLTPAQLATILGQDPDLERYVYGPGEVPVAYNERHRLFTGKLRAAIQVRDRHCTALGCDRPARYCDVDHIEPVDAGGTTRPDNGRVACGQDNRARPRRRFAGDPDPP